MSITAGQDVVATDFITQSSGASDSGKVPKFDTDGRLHTKGIRNGFGGTGSDGSKTVSSSENIDAAGADYVTKNYTTLTINASQTLGLINPASAGTVLHIKVQGDCTINGTISVNYCGAIAGTGATSATNGGDGTNGKYSFESVVRRGQGGRGSTTGGPGAGGGGGGHQVAGTAGSGDANAVGGQAGAAVNALIFDTFVDIRRRAIFFVMGSGGGGGSDGRLASGGAGTFLIAGADGGRGGGVLILEVGGNLTFGASSNLNAAGQNGSDAADFNWGGASFSQSGGGGGGGGSGGQIYVVYNGTLTNSGVTTNVAGGVGGQGGDPIAFGTAGWDGGNGGAGDYYIAKNTEIA